MFASSRCKRSDLDVLYDRLRQLEKEYSDLMLQQQQTENIISENNAALTQKSLEIRQLKTLVEDKNTELREQVERNSASSQEISFLNQKLAEVKEKRKIDKIKIKELEAEINRLRCENAELRSAKEVAEIRAQQYKAEIDRLQEQVNKHETEITTTKEIYKNQVIEEIKTLMRTGCRSSLENELSLPYMTALQEELNGILSEAKTPKEAARKFMENHPELNIIQTDKVSLFKSALEVLKFKAGVGKYDEIFKKMNAVGKPEDVRFQSYFLELLQNKNDGSQIAAEILEEYPDLYFPLPELHLEILKVIKEKLNSSHAEAVFNSIHSSEQQVPVRRLFHDTVFAHKGSTNYHRIGRRFVSRSGYPFSHLLDNIFGSIMRLWFA